MFELVRNTRPGMLKRLNSLSQDFGNVERIFDDLFHFHGVPTVSGIDKPLFSPSLEFIDKKNKYIASVELPGINQKDIDISFNEEDDILIIKGEKREKNKEENDDYYICERSYGSFRREIPLPHNVEKDKIEATFDKGILTLEIPKKKEITKKSKKIEIKTK
jgi:HSP20 family protein